jgi:uncharacterized protein (DUF58 family)
LFVFGTLVATISSYLLNHNLVMLASAMFVAIPVYHWVYLKLALNQCEHRLIWPDQLFANRKSLLRLELTVRRRMSMSQVDIFIDLEGEPALYQKVARLDRDQTSTVAFDLLASRRGLLKSRRFLISSSAPFGLVGRTLEMAWDEQKVVFPELLRQLPPSLEAKSEDRGVLPRQSDDFQYLDTYNPSDDVRMIHWRKSAQSDVPVMRRDQSNDHRLQTHVLVPDASPYFEHAVKALATFFHKQSEMTVWQVVTADGIRSIRDPYEMLAFLALVQPVEASVVEGLLDRNQVALYFSAIFGKNEAATSAV